MKDRHPPDPDGAAAALAASEQRFGRTFNDAPTPIAMADTQRRLLRVNPAFCKLFGYPEAELLGRTTEHFTHPDDLARDVAAVGEMLAGEREGYATEKRYLRRDGSTLEVVITVSLVAEPGGEEPYFVVHYQDVTTARANERALQDVRALLEESQTVGQIGSWSYLFEADDIIWSREQFRLHGIDPTNGHPSVERFLESVHPDDREGVRGAIAAARGTPGAFAGGYRVQRPDGSVRFLRVSADVLPADPATGRPARITGTTWDVTAEREARRAQHAAEARQQGLLERLPDTMFILYDRELRCTLMQGRLLDTLGIDPTAYLGERIGDVSETAVLERVAPKLHGALRGEPARVEFESASGRTFEVEFAPHGETGGEITGVLTVWRDISARIAQQNENRMLATMVQQSEDAIIAKDPDGVIIAWNAGAERLYGYPAEQAIGSPIGLIIPPERAGEDRTLLERALAGEVSQRETTRLHRDGHRVSVSISVSPLRDGLNRITGALVIARDTSERVRAETERRAAEERLRVTIEHAPTGVGLVDLRPGSRGRLLSVNDAFSSLIGTTDRLGEHVHPDDAAEWSLELGHMARDPRARMERELRFVRGDGAVVWVLLTGAPVPAELGPPKLAVVHALDIGERRRMQTRLQHLADHDALTGLYNRRRFEEELRRMVSLVDRYAFSSALLVLDLDGFKHVNDTLGHSYGDELLTRVGAALRGCLRETDVVGRLGGDEFAVLLGSTSTDEALLVAEKLLRAVQSDGVVQSDEVRAAVTVSVGVAPFGRADLRDAESLLMEADLAMYRAKEAGRDRVAIAQPATDGVHLALQRSWRDRLRRALDEGHFELHAQAVRDLRGALADGYELLLRLREPGGELVPPGVFLPGAERYDLIQEIDRWVFTEALALLARYEAAGIRLQLAINMSGRTLCDPNIIDDLRASFAACPVRAGRLVVEVTETAAIVNVERARAVARALRGLGCRFALDDFGAGFASFYYLKHLEFDFLKIDGEFVRSLLTDATDELVIRSVVELARGLGAQTVAEFVGDDATAERLRELGVGWGQGYHLGRPAPLAEVLPALPVAPLVGGR